MEIAVHAPSPIVLVVSLALAVLALICYFVAEADIAFWSAIMAYTAAAGGAMIKTD